MLTVVDTPPSAAVNPTLEKMVVELLADVRAGRVTDLAYVAATSDAGWLTAHSDTDKASGLAAALMSEAMRLLGFVQAQA